MAWKTNAKQDGCKGEGPAARMSGKAPFPTTGTVARDAKGSHSGGGDQMNPRRDRRQGYVPSPQAREQGVKHG